MMRICDRPSDYNVIIFNNIKNNKADIRLLMETFTSLNCRIKYYELLTLQEFDNAIQEICIADFHIYKYIAVVVLDNKNYYHHRLTTSDDKELRINNDLLFRILQNRTLLHKPRLYIVQTDQIYSDEPLEDPKMYYREPPQYDEKGNRKKIPFYDGPLVRLYATHPESQLEDYWQNENAPPSPFIAAFCRNFAKYGENETIPFVYNQLCKDLKKEEIMPIIDQNTNSLTYGKALTDENMDNFFPPSPDTSCSDDE